METQQFRTSITAAWDLDSGTLIHIRPHPWLHQTKEFQSEPYEEEILRETGKWCGDQGPIPVRFLSLDSPKTAYTEQVLSWLFFGRQEDKQRRTICIAATIPSINKNSDEGGNHPSAWLALIHLQSRVFSTLALVPQF